MHVEGVEQKMSSMNFRICHIWHRVSVETYNSVVRSDVSSFTVCCVIT